MTDLQVEAGRLVVINDECLPVYDDPPRLGESADEAEPERKVIECQMWHFDRHDGWTRRCVRWRSGETDDDEMWANGYFSGYVIGPTIEPSWSLYLKGLGRAGTVNPLPYDYIVLVEICGVWSEYILVGDFPSLLALLPQLKAWDDVAAGEQYWKDVERREGAMAKASQS